MGIWNWLELSEGEVDIVLADVGAIGGEAMGWAGAGTGCGVGIDTGGGTGTALVSATVGGAVGVGAANGGDIDEVVSSSGLLSFFSSARISISCSGSVVIN